MQNADNAKSLASNHKLQAGKVINQRLISANQGLTWPNQQPISTNQRLIYKTDALQVLIFEDKLAFNEEVERTIFDIYTENISKPKRQNANITAELQLNNTAFGSRNEIMRPRILQ